MRHIWLKYIRPIVYPWYYERDPDIGFRRWLRETENGRAGYRHFRATIMEWRSDLFNEWPEQLSYDED